MTTRILLIDDDLETIEAYRNVLEPKAPEWSLCFAETVAAGVEAAHQHAPDIVIASYAIEGDQGAKVLAAIEQAAPDAQCFITAKASDKPKLESTFGSTFQFLPSPCPADRLITEIQRCIAIDTWLGNDRVKELVAKMGEFPSLPPIYIKVVNALNARNASAESIAHAISGDLAISAKVLQTVNSSFYGFDEKISNITHAVSILGTECVKNLVLAIQVFNKMGRTAEQKAITDQLWHHSMSVAVAARRITAFETENDKEAEEAYSAGLMHDIGKLILLNAVPELFAKARDLANDKNLSSWEAENEVIGSNHAEVGAYVLARWGMPASLSEAVALHHEPVNSFGKSFSALAAVHVANAIVHERQNADHPCAKANADYLGDIGKAGAWESWQAVACGKEPPPQTKPRRQTNETPKSEPQASPEQQESKKEEPTAKKTASEPVSLANKKAQEQKQEKQESAPAKKSSKTGPAIAIAACCALAAGGVYFLANFDSNPSATTAADRSPASTLDDVDFAAEESEPIGPDNPAAALAPTAEDLEVAAADESPIETAETPAAETSTEPVSQKVDSDTIAKTVPEPQLEETLAAVESPKAEEAPAHPKPKIQAPEDSFPNLSLTGIFYNADRPLASVNGSLRRVGDTVSGAKILRIDKTRIVVQFESDVRAINLN